MYVCQCTSVSIWPGPSTQVGGNEAENSPLPPRQRPYRWHFKILHESWSFVSQVIVEFVAIRCQILNLKCTKFDFGCWSLHCSLRPSSCIKGALLLRGEEGKGEEMPHLCRSEGDKRPWLWPLSVTSAGVVWPRVMTVSVPSWIILNANNSVCYFLWVEYFLYSTLCVAIQPLAAIRNKNHFLYL